MKDYVVKYKQARHPLLQPKAILVGITVLNSALVYLLIRDAERRPGVGRFCFGAPWHILPSLANIPLLLLIGAVGLYLKRWWGYLVAVASCASVFYPGAVEMQMVYSLDIWWSVLIYQPGLLFQYVLAATILIAIAGKSLRQRPLK